LEKQSKAESSKTAWVILLEIEYDQSMSDFCWSDLQRSTNSVPNCRSEKCNEKWSTKSNNISQILNYNMHPSSGLKPPATSKLLCN